MNYKEKLEEAKRLYESANDDQKNILEIIYPELRESEDEKIRTGLINGFNECLKNSQYPNNVQKYWHNIKIEDILSWLEKQDGQNPIDKIEQPNKIEPKFKIGDWIVLYGLVLYIYEIVDGYYRTVDIDDIHCSYVWTIDNIARLWTIQDAKDGDVLAWNDSKCITIFKNIYDEVSFNSYGAVGHCTGTFESGQSYHDIEDAHPATKEQRDTLIKAMTDAGYTFDFEKKELKRIEQKPVDDVDPKFHVGDWVLYSGDNYEGVRHITKIDENGYYIERNGLPHGIIPFNHEICMRLWIIQDAKDGDVLTEWNNTAFIFKAIEDETVKFHIAYNEKWDTIKTPSTTLFHLGLPEPQFEFHPATKKQRDLLFQKMKESDYEWDAEKKELRKIENKNPLLSDFFKAEYERGKADAQKPTWGEEDKARIKQLLGWIDTLKNYIHYDALVSLELRRKRIDKVSRLESWLKSLKQRMNND